MKNFEEFKSAQKRKKELLKNIKNGSRKKSVFESDIMRQHVQ